MAPQPASPWLVSTWLGGLDGFTWQAERDREPHLAASTMKLPLAIAAYRAHEAGRLDLDAPVAVHDNLASAVPGSRFSPRPDDDQEHATWSERGQATALRTLVSRAISWSGNLASCLVLQQVGRAAVAETLAAAGCSPTTAVVRAVGDEPARAAGMENLVTARDLGLVLAALAGGRLVGHESTAALVADLRAQHHRSGIAAGLPPGLEVASKSGWIDGVAHDAALVRPAEHPAFVLVVLTRHDDTEQAGDALVAQVAARAWRSLGRRGARRESRRP